MPPPQIGWVEQERLLVQELTVVVVVVVAVHVSDVECERLDDGVQAGRVGVYHGAHAAVLELQVAGAVGHAPPSFVCELTQPFLPPPRL